LARLAASPRWAPARSLRARCWLLFYLLTPLLVIFLLSRSADMQRELRQLQGLPPTLTWHSLMIALTALLVSGLLVSTGILCASYTCFTYAVLILGPSHPAGWMIILIMFGYGLASLVGNTFTGRLTEPMLDDVFALAASVTGGR
jgi:predicted MFS family arabinose efflux permease